MQTRVEGVLNLKVVLHSIRRVCCSRQGGQDARGLGTATLLELEFQKGQPVLGTGYGGAGLAWLRLRSE